jgi:hypothetical protein
MKTLKSLLTKTLVACFDAAALACLFPLAFSAMLLPDAGREFSEWYDARCKGSWLRLWA